MFKNSVANDEDQLPARLNVRRYFVATEHSRLNY